MSRTSINNIGPFTLLVYTCAQTGKSRVYLQDAHAGYWYQVRVAAVTPDGHSDFAHSAPVLVAAAVSDVQPIGALLSNKCSCCSFELV